MNSYTMNSYQEESLLVFGAVFIVRENEKESATSQTTETQLDKTKYSNKCVF